MNQFTEDDRIIIKTVREAVETAPFVGVSDAIDGYRVDARLDSDDNEVYLRISDGDVAGSTYIPVEASDEDIIDAVIGMEWGA